MAEKPSVARSLAGVFNSMPGSREARGMRREAAQIFEHNNVQFPDVMQQGSGQRQQGPNRGHTMITTSVRGHLAHQDFGPAYGWNKCDPFQLFDAPMETSYRNEMDALARMLGNQARNCQVVILWLDCDREGEAIADEVREVCRKANPRLRFLRAKFSTVMPAEIQRALQSLGVVNEAFVQAVQARSELDLRIGAAFTRFQTLRLQKRFAGFEKGKVVSYGGCQFPTLGFIVERWARIETFVPETFWFIDLKLQVPVPHDDNETQGNNNSRSISFTWRRGRLYDRLMTLVLYESCLDVGEATVTQLRGITKKKWRPVPLSTVELQKRASRYERIGSEMLMKAAENLYQSGYISYPRTETEVFRREFQHQPLLQDLANNGGEFQQYAAKLLTGSHFQTPRAGRNDDNAHPPITPCKAVDPTTITDPTERKVYKLIVKHYLACCSRDAEGKETQLTVRMGTEEFNAKGLMVTERNWLEVYHPYERWSNGQGELPPLDVGSHIVPSVLNMQEGQTVAPLPISEVELISLMDRHGIGTDATIATHIATIQDREYAIKDANQRFLPSDLGIALVEGYNSMGYQLNKPDLRRELEAECNHVAAGRKQKDEIMSPILEKMRQCYQTACVEARKLDEAIGRRFSRLGTDNRTTETIEHQFSLCGSCNAMMDLKRINGGGNNRNDTPSKLLFCGTCQQGHMLPRGSMKAKVEAETGRLPIKCPICSFQVVQVLRGEGYTGNGYHFCPKCYSDPPIEHGGVAGADFRCFLCTNRNCELATGSAGAEIIVFPCPFCSRSSPRNHPVGQVRLKKQSTGYNLGCSNWKNPINCKYTIWCPKEAENVEVDATNCEACSIDGKTVPRFKFTWKRGSVPPLYGRDTTVCILCDRRLQHDFQINVPQLNLVTPNQRCSRVAAGRGSRAAGGRGGRDVVGMRGSSGRGDDRSRGGRY